MKLEEILNYSVGSFTVGKLLAAVVTFVVLYIISKLLYSLIGKLIERTSLDGTLKKYFRLAVKLVMYFIIAVVVVETLGISPTSFIAAFSVLGLAASLAVQSTLSNVASGIMVMVSKPFKRGDFIEVDSESGTVASISLIHTKLLTIDNKKVYIPNSKISDSKIINYTSQENRRVDLEICASYDAPINTVREALIKAVEASEYFIDTPEKPFAAVLSYDESSIRYVVRAWTRTKDYWQAYFALTENIKYEFDRAKVEMTYNHINVHMTEK